MNKLTEIKRKNENLRSFINASSTKLTTWEEDLLNDVFTLISLLEEKDKALAIYADEENWGADGHGYLKIFHGADEGYEIARKALNTSSNSEGE